MKKRFNKYISNKSQTSINHHLTKVRESKKERKTIYYVVGGAASRCNEQLMEDYNVFIAVT